MAWNRGIPGSALAACAIAMMSTPSSAQAVPPNYGFQWATVTAVNNRPYEGNVSGMRGRGSVGYAYRIAKTEITTNDWLEFVNAVAVTSPQPFQFGLPTFWGAEREPVGPFGRWRLRTDLPNAGNIPVYNLQWEHAAYYCNWLNNGKPSNFDAITDGAYGPDTFSYSPHYNPSAVHKAGARYWIPTLDEWIKAVHFDPHAEDPRFPGQGRWWQQPNGTDTPLTPGLPGEGQTSAFATFYPYPGFDWRWIPVGAYSTVTTPWGLLDASGGARELNEDNYFPGIFDYRGADGGEAGDLPALADLDTVGGTTGFPGGFAGIRLASAIPSPAVAGVLFLWFGTQNRRRRR